MVSYPPLLSLSFHTTTPAIFLLSCVLIVPAPLQQQQTRLMAAHGQQWSELHKAAQAESIARTNALVSTGSIDINEAGPRGVTPLMMAAEKDHAHVVKILLNKGANVSISSRTGFSALTYSVGHGHVPATKLLLEAGADVEVKTEAGCTPLHLAVDRGHSHVTRLMIEAGADADRRFPEEGQTPLYHAAAGGRIETLVELLRGNADPLLTTGAGKFTPLDVAAGKGHSKTVLELIQHVGIERCGGESGGVDALHYAAQKQRVETMAVLAGAGVVDAGVALNGAVKSGSERSVKFLLQQQPEENVGPYANRTDQYGNTPLLHVFTA